MERTSVPKFTMDGQRKNGCWFLVFDSLPSINPSDHCFEELLCVGSCCFLTFDEVRMLCAKHLKSSNQIAQSDMDKSPTSMGSRLLVFLTTWAAGVARFLHPSAKKNLTCSIVFWQGAMALAVVQSSTFVGKHY